MSADESFEFSSATIRTVYKASENMVCAIDNVLSKAQCDEIVSTSKEQYFQDMSNKYNPKTRRNNSRLLVIDQGLSEILWNRLESVISKLIEKYDIPCRPLGFDVLRGNWELAGMNNAIRINKYSRMKREFFAPHKDAQYCPSGDERSVFSLVIYLNQGFKGGETCFYFPKDSTLQTKGLTIEEEIKVHGGLEEGFDHVKVTPSTGSAVLFSQNTLHESLPMITRSSKVGYKVILKTDVMLKRTEKPFGFAVSKEEKDDYFKCLNYFREAQQEELDSKADEAAELYERALSIRYSYPFALKTRSQSEWKVCPPSITDILPAVVWENIFSYLSGKDAEHLIYAFPDLIPVKKLQDGRFACKLKTIMDEKRPKFLPRVGQKHGIYTRFEFPDAEFFKRNGDGCCRVAAMYSFFLLGHTSSEEMYTVRFNPETQEVCALPLEQLLWDTFYSKPCYGCIYKVQMQGTEEKNPDRDFQASVDRSYMAYRHSAEFVGVELLESFRVNTELYENTIPYGCDEYMKSASSDSFSSELSDSDYDSSKTNHSDSESDNESNVETEHTNHSENNIGNNSEIDCVNNSDVTSSNDDSKKATKYIHVHYDSQCLFDVQNDNLLCLMDRAGFFKGLSLDMDYTTKVVKSIFYAFDGDSSDDSSEDCTPIANDLNEINITEEYLGTLIKLTKQRNNVSGAVVSSITQPFDVNFGDLCFCQLRDHDDNVEGCVEFAKRCETSLFNHLVFDFQENQLNVERPDDNGNSSYCCSCFLEQVLDSHVKVESEEKAEDSLIVGEMMHFIVKIDPLAETFVPFNHASCQCIFPRFRLNEYCNLRNYPYLNHIHLIAQEFDDKMYVWSVYGGIVAL